MSDQFGVDRPSISQEELRGLRAAARSNLIGSVLLDRSWRVVWASQFLRDLLGHDESSRGLSVTEFCHPDDLDDVINMLAVEVEQPFAGHLALRQRYMLDLRIRTASGDWMWCEINGANFYDDPDIDGFLVQILRQSNQHTRLRSLLATAEGQPMTAALAVLLESFTTGGPREQSAAIIDRDRVVLASQAPGIDVGAILPASPPATSPLAARNQWSVPIAHPGTSSDLGELVCWDRHEVSHPFDLRHARAIAPLAAIIIERYDFDQRLRQAAWTDELTGLANRAAFRQHLATLLMNGSNSPTGNPTAVIYVDLDRFKRINDGYGHAAGDAVLCEVARRLAGTAADGDVVARIGGDEFVVVTRAPGDVAARLAAVRAIFATPVVTEGGALPVDGSVGLAIATAASTVDGLVSAADHAMFAEKFLRRSTAAA